MTYKHIADYDFTPSIFRGEDEDGFSRSYCEQCGHMSDHVASIYSENGKVWVDYRDMISCYDWVTVEEPASDFLDYYANNSNLFRVDDEFQKEFEKFLAKVEKYASRENKVS